MAINIIHGNYLKTQMGWYASCSCDAGDPVPCTVLDPFGGAGTVGVVAKKSGQDAILIDLNSDYVKMARNRIRGIRIDDDVRPTY